MKDYALSRLLAKTAHRRTRVAKPSKVSSRVKGKRVDVVIVDELVDLDADTIAEFNGSHADDWFERMQASCKVRWLHTEPRAGKPWRDQLDADEAK